jgi:hypothetical protein
MRSLARLQLVGPLVLFCAVGAAEAAAYALADDPSSALLWYLNLEVFSIFRKSRMALADYGAVPFAQLLIVGPLALLAIAGLVWRRNLMVAISSNLSLIYAGFLLCSWHYWNSAGQAKTASLAAVQMPTGSDFYLFAVLLLASFMSFAASHYVYLRLLRSHAR